MNHPVRRVLEWGVALACAGFVVYALLSALFAVIGPIGWIKTLADFPQVMWDRLPHVPGLSQATKDVPAAIARTEAAQVALREQAAAANAALRQAGDARAQATALKAQLAQAKAALVPVLKRQSELEALNRRHATRIRELETALATVRAKPVAPVTSRQGAVDTLKRLGY
jgi:hypothetical protein